MKKVYVILNFIRIFIGYICIKLCKFRKKCAMDIDVYCNKTDGPKNIFKTKLFKFGYCLIFNKSLRNVLLNRLHRNFLLFIIFRLLFKPLDSLYINMPPEDIGGGLYFLHGFSTILTANKIGEYCSINQQVTIGWTEKGRPTIKDRVTIMAGAIVIGDILIDDEARIGAGAVVISDVPAKSTVVGVPAKVINNNR